MIMDEVLKTNKMKVLSKLGIGPMSEEIIESVFRYSQRNNASLMLIASKNQIDWNGGYVNNWTTKQYTDYIKSLKNIYPGARVSICRDHCGPGFKNDDLDDVYKTIASDIGNGFDLIHIDFCRFKGGKGNVLQESKKAIEFAKKLKPEILIEVGTDDNAGEFLDNVSSIEEDIKYFLNIAPIHFFVCQTGSLIKEINQVGGFNSGFLNKLRTVADKYNIFLKEHNADYISSDDIKKRKGLIDAVNVAPQYGVIQTKLTLQKALTYGVDISEFIEETYKNGKWKKWLHINGPENKYLCATIAGHYSFSSEAYRNLYRKISDYENFRESIISEIMKNFDLYLNNL